MNQRDSAVLPVTHECHTLLGIDLGGTKLAAGLLQWPTGQIITSCRQPTDAARGAEAVLDDVRRCIDTLRCHVGATTGPVKGVGIGVPELVDRHGLLCSAATLDWQSPQILDELVTCAQAPVVWEADVRAAARAEATLGAGRDSDSFVYVSIGTGISCCLVIQGTPYRGARGLTGTFASSRLGVVDDDEHWREGPPLEAIASGAGIARRYQQQTNASAAIATTAEVFRRAHAGEMAARTIVVSAGRALGVAVGQLVNTLDPARVIVGGGVGITSGLFRTTWEATARESIWSPLHRDVPIVTAACGHDAGWIGAALSCLREDAA